MKENILYGLVGIVVGIALAQLSGFSAINTASMNQQESEEKAMGMDSLEGKRDDEFDKAFIDAMILHHEEAIEMAHEALKYGKHDEIEQLANDIVTAQESEIEKMKEWRQVWQY